MGLSANPVLPIVTSPLVVNVSSHIPGQRICTEGSSSSNYEETTSFDTSIYRILSMQDDMKTYSFNGRARNEFEQFIAAAISKTNLVSYNTAFDSLDEYLGTLGVTHGVC